MFTFFQYQLFLPEDDNEDQTSETSCLVQTIVNNIQLTIDRVHVRYEDTLTNPTQPYACGVMMKSFAITTTDKQWNATDNVSADLTQINKVSISKVYTPRSCV